MLKVKVSANLGIGSHVWCWDIGVNPNEVVDFLRKDTSEPLQFALT